MKVLAVIPARGGSKRIPNKNIIEFMGKPMIVQTIEAAIKSNIFHRILISTDSKKIAEVANNYGIDTPFFRTEKYDDLSTVSEATLFAVNQAESHFEEKYDYVVQLMPNTPLRNDNDIVNHFKNFIDTKVDFQISCFKFGWMNPWWAFKLNNSGEHEWLFNGNYNTRSQDLDDLFCPTGAIWIADVKKLRNSKTFYGPGFRFHELNWVNAVDIDNYDDLEFAKVLFNSKKC